MKLTIEVDETDTMTVDEVAAKIAHAQGWEIVTAPSADKGTGFVAVVKTKAGRVGRYDVPADCLTWNDDPNETEYYCFVGDDDEFYLANSLLEFLDVTTAIWGDDEDGNLVLYTE